VIDIPLLSRSHEDDLRATPEFSRLRHEVWSLLRDDFRPAAHRTQPLHRSREALATVGLVDRAAEWPSNLSGGQKLRVALASALVSVPRILALDDPLGALDALTRIEMQRLLENVWVSNGFTAILVTHDVAEAVAPGDRNRVD
jgi:sulfonate transport system ATP-binding protein